MPNNIERPRDMVKAFCCIPSCTRAVYVFPECLRDLASGKLSIKAKEAVFMCDEHRFAHLPHFGGHSAPRFIDDPSPWEENNVRALEDGME